MNAPAIDPVQSYRCEHCDKLYAGSQVAVVRVGDGVLPACPTCQRGVVAQARATQRTAQPIGEVLFDGLRLWDPPGYLLSWASMAVGYYLLAFLMGSMFAIGISSAYALAILRQTSRGIDEPAAPTDFLDVLDVFGWVLRFWLTLSLVFFPIFVALFTGAQITLFEVLLLALPSMVLLPAAMIGASRGGWIESLNPVPWFRLMFRAPRAYAIAVGFCVLVLLCQVLFRVVTSVVATALENVPLLPGIFSTALLSYLPIAMCRSLGLLVHEHREEFGIE